MYVNNLSFDPAHVWFPVPGDPRAVWAVEVFTTESVYGLDPGRTVFDGVRLTATRLQFLGGQRHAPGEIDALLSVDDGAVSWRLDVRADTSVKGVKLLLRGLPLDLEGGFWTPTTAVNATVAPADGKPVLLTYPWDNWQTPWACAGDGPGVVLSVRDEAVRPKRLYAYRPHWTREPVVEIVVDELATRRASRFIAPEIRLRRCESAVGIRSDLDDHLKWLEAAFGLTRWEERADVPAWADDLDLVVTLHGQHWTGFVFNTFDRMATILEEVVEYIPGERVLAYLPGWEGRYYWQYPSYSPGRDLGGVNGFERLTATARRLGVHLMPMFGANGAHVSRYPDWERAAFRSPSDRYPALVNAPDWDNDRSAEDDQVFLNPGSPAFRRHLAEQVTAVVDRFGVEGVFLDTSGCWFNDPRHDVYDGYRELVEDLHARHPELLVCGEGWYDALLSVFPMNQTWIPMGAPARFEDLPLRYTRLLAHLKDGAPGSGSSGVHEAGTSAPAVPVRVGGFTPALPVVEDTFTEHREAALAFLRAVAAQREPLEEIT